MSDLFGETAFDIVPSRKISGIVAGTLVADGHGFETRACAELDVDFDGVRDDFHAGMTRRSGGREPWYPRGTEIRNERQVSIVAPDELDMVARRMGLARLRPEWLGANLVLDDVPHLSMIPAGAMIFFEGGVTLKVDAQNGPCRIAGRAVAREGGMTDPEGGALLFAKVAKRLRGLVAWVEKPGRIRSGEKVSVRVPEQWIYR